MSYMRRVQLGSQPSKSNSNVPKSQRQLQAAGTTLSLQAGRQPIAKTKKGTNVTSCKNEQGENISRGGVQLQLYSHLDGSISGA